MSYASVFRPDLFAGQRILITGGGTGIGRTIARELASLGAEVVLAGRRREPLERACEELQAQRGRAFFQETDIRSEEAVAALLDRCLPIQGLVNNAGGQFYSPAEAISLKGWKAVVETNLTGTFLVCREVYRRCLQDQGGAVVNVVAEMWRGFPGMAHTGAARAGVVNLTRTLAVEWARSGVRVNAVAPGIIEGEGLRSYPPEMEPVLARAREDLPFRRLGTESEVASAVTFLLSPGAAYISGDTLRVDGAASLWRKTWDIPAHDRFPRYQG